MRDKLSKIKMAFYDVDNTLLYIRMYDNDGKNIKADGKRVIGHSSTEAWLKYNITNNAYRYCKAPKPMKNLVKYLDELYSGDRKIKQWALTECSNSFEQESKYQCVKREYNNVFRTHTDVISIDHRSKKVFIMQTIAEQHGLRPDEILFIDDSYTEVMQAFDAGFVTMHTTEALIRFADMANLDLED